MKRSGKIERRVLASCPRAKAKSRADPQKKRLEPAQLSSAELHEAVWSLYEDELKPYGRILRKRLAERNANGGKEADLSALRKMCEADPQLLMESEDGGEWSARFTDVADSFVDVYGKDDPYDEAVWQAAQEYFESLPEEDGVLPGGRYACAQTLLSQDLHFLRGLTLGRICHFVQIAISTRKVLGYLNGGITSYSRSHSCVKDTAASHKASCAQTAIVSDLVIATWDDARRCLKEILTKCLKDGVEQMPLSNVKRICRSQHKIELSETSLGHSRLSDLLQDEELSSICTVKLLEQGYFVIPRFSLCDDESFDSLEDSLSCDSLTLDVDELDELDKPATPCWSDQIQQSPFDLSLDVEARPVPLPRVRNTFIDAPVAPITSSSRRARSAPREVVNTSPLLYTISGRSPATRAQTPVNISSPFDLVQTPDQWASLTPGASPHPYFLHSVPEAQTLEPEKFNWSDQEYSWNMFGCMLEDFTEPAQEAVPESPSPFLCREPLTGARAAPVALTLADHV